jgi:hypothetical protein
MHASHHITSHYITSQAVCGSGARARVVCACLCRVFVRLHACAACTRVACGRVRTYTYATIAYAVRMRVFVCPCVRVHARRTCGRACLLLARLTRLLRAVAQLAVEKSFYDVAASTSRPTVVVFDRGLMDAGVLRARAPARAASVCARAGARWVARCERPCGPARVTCYWMHGCHVRASRAPARVCVLRMRVTCPPVSPASRHVLLCVLPRGRGVHE